MTDSGSLSDGVVICRLANGEWWHGHLVRSDLEYASAMLGRRTNLLFLLVKFGCGASRKSADFYLTLDGEGVPEELLPIRFRGDWDERGDGTATEIEALHLQDHVLPLLQDCDPFQEAMASIVCKQAYGKTAAAEQFIRISGEL